MVNLQLTQNVDIKKAVEENNYIPLEPFCSTLGDTVPTEEYLNQIKEKKSMPAYLLNVEDISYDEVLLVDEELKEELSGIRKKEPEGPKNTYFWVKTEKGFRKAYRWELAFPG